MPRVTSKEVKELLHETTEQFMEEIIWGDYEYEGHNKAKTRKLAHTIGKLFTKRLIKETDKFIKSTGD